MSRPKILITNSDVPQAGIDLLKQSCDLIQIKNTTRTTILENVTGVDALFWATKELLNAEILDKAGPNLKTVGVMSAGFNQIDVDELKKRGIKAGNTPGVLDDAVAEIAVLLTIGAGRRLHEGLLKMQTDQWISGHQWMLGQDISGSTVGIVGLGNIGQAILKRLVPFKVAKFLYTGHREKEEGKKLGAEFVSFDTLLKTSDFIIAICPLTAETRHMFDSDAFAKMKPTSVFVNVARGEVVDQEALVNALKSKQIFAAGLDVMTPEPLPADHELLTLPNVVLIPHLGSATIKTRNAMSELTAKNILRGLAGEEMLTPIS